MTQQWSSEAQRKIADIAAKNGFSEEAGLAMAEAISRGVGSMAQFNHRDLGGQGQWVRGGMLMIADMFNDNLKSRVRSLAETLADAAQRGAIQPQSAPGGADGGGGNTDRSANWWPSSLGQAGSGGAQNGMRYAVFAQARRVAIERDGKVTVHDSGDHRIGGVSQQQGSQSSLRFSSQHGDIGLDALPEVKESRSQTNAPGGDAPDADRADAFGSSTPADAAAPGAGRVEAGASLMPEASPTGTASIAKAAIEPSRDAKDPVALIRKLAELRDAGILTEQEFADKKTELLARL